MKYCQVLSSWRIERIKEVDDDDDVSQHVKDDDEVDNDDDN